MLDFLGGLVSAGSNLLGGMFNQQNQQQINQANIAASQEYAQNQVQWRVADAKKAGISPLAALGLTGPASAPVSVGSDSFGRGVAGAGQDIGRAMESLQSGPDRSLDYARKAMELESMNLDNEIKRASLSSHVATRRQAAQPPGVDIRPSKTTASGSGPTVDSGPSELAVIPEQGWARTTNGGYMPVMSADMQNRNYGVLGDAQFFINNRLAPGLGVNFHPPYEAPKGKFWTFGVDGAYHLHDPIPYGQY